MSTLERPALPCACGKGRASYRDNMCGHCRPPENPADHPSVRLFTCSTPAPQALTSHQRECLDALGID